MAKIFVSYKYKDTSVYPLEDVDGVNTVRDYVDILENRLLAIGHTYKGEDDGEDLSGLSEERIAELLYDRIYDSTITIVLISKNMREDKPEKHQWIHREVQYSLTEHSRGGRTSHTNAVLAVVIPDEGDGHGHFIREDDCGSCSSRTILTNAVFGIIGRNMFNHKKIDETKTECESCSAYRGDHSYIPTIKWNDFIDNIGDHLDKSLNINENVSDYDIKKEIF